MTLKHAFRTPLEMPYVWIAWMAYSEQVGQNLHVRGNEGETAFW